MYAVVARCVSHSPATRRYYAVRQPYRLHAPDGEHCPEVTRLRQWACDRELDHDIQIFAQTLHSHRGFRFNTGLRFGPGKPVLILSARLILCLRHALHFHYVKGTFRAALHRADIHIHPPESPVSGRLRHSCPGRYTA